MGLIAGGLTISEGGPEHETLSHQIVYAQVDLFANLATPTLVPPVTYVPDWARTPTPVPIPEREYGVGAEQWRSLVCNAPFTWLCDWALATIACESGGDPNAVGQEWYEGELWYFVGLWQIATRDQGRIPALQNPARSTDEASWKYNHGGVSHWPICGH